MIVHLLNFNNYYNRTYKPLSSNDDYSDYIVYIPDNDVNFNPNDGVNTVLVMNMPSMFDDKANYLVTVENREITSRWFIIDAERTRLNQYQMTLRRDLLADYFEDITNAPTFIEKATVGYGNPLLLNPEDMTFNQIKTKETPIKDETECAWIVGYIDRKTEAKSININSAVRQVPTYDTWADAPFGSYRDTTVKTNVSDLYFSMYYVPFAPPPAAELDYLDKIQFNMYGDTTFTERKLGLFERNDYINITTTSSQNTSQEFRYNNGKRLARGMYEYFQANEAAFKQNIGYLDSEETANLFNTYTADGSIIKVGENYYRMTLNKISNNVKETIAVTAATYGDLQDLLEVTAESTSAETSCSVGELSSDNNFKLTMSYSVYRLEATAISAPIDTEYTLSLPAANQRPHLEDAPYDMFCIPYPKDVTRYWGIYDGTFKKSISAQVSMLAAQAIAISLGSQLYDLQLLPYCPIAEVKDAPLGYGPISIANLNATDYNWVYSGESYNNTSIVIWARQSTFSTTITHVKVNDPEGTVTSKSIAIKVTEPKIQAMCDMYRLCSPNYSSQFEFNAVKNEGVEYFVADCTYKPYQPYIRVAPNFKGLYGTNFNDARGLICGGDFSLPTMSDAFIQYEINNKNYINAFDRQIDNMEINQKYQRMAEMINAVAGTAAGGVSGASTGFIMSGGNVPGAIAAGASAALLSGAAGMADVNINDKLRSEAIDYTKDQFGYSLGNIRAMPTTLNKVSAFNINNKIFPILEYYTCTETEKQALRNKIKYNGMSIGVIGTIQEYIQEEETYIKGRLIRIEGLDNHTTTEIANELNKGFYIKPKEEQ